MSVTPSPIDVVGAQIEARLGGVHTCMPGEVIRIHDGAHARQFVDVQPSLQRQVYDEDGELVNETLPLVPMVPVAYSQGGGFFVAVPLAVGDIVLLVFAERSLDVWIETARKRSGGAAVVPGDVGEHCLEGAIALPCGPAPRRALLAGVDATDLVIGGPSGVLARFTTSGDIVFAEGDMPVALAGPAGNEYSRIKADLDALKTALEHAFAACTPLPTAPLAPAEVFTTMTAAFPSAPNSVASAKVKAR